MRPPRGFTLVEMLVTLAIVLILAMIVYPSARSYFLAGRHRNALRDVAATLELARSESSRRNSTLYVAVTPGTDWCVGVGSQACDCSRCDIRVVTAAAYPDVALQSSFDRGYQIDPVNTVVSIAGTLTLTADALQGSVTVNKLGRVSVCPKASCGDGAP